MSKKALPQYPVYQRESDQIPVFYRDDWDIAKESAFITNKEQFAFSPATYEPFSLQNMALSLLIIKYSKTAEDRKLLAQIIIKYLDSCARMIESVQDACHSNWLTALNNQHITAAISHRIGLIDDLAFYKIMEHYRAVFDKLYVLEGALGALSGVTTLVQGAKYTTSQESPEGKEMTSVAGLAGLLKLAGKI